MCFSSVMALFAYFMMGQISQAGPEIHKNMPAIFKFFPLIATVQFAVAVLGFVSGINFLKLKYWSRTVLEILTWLLLVFLVIFGGFFVYQWISTSFKHSSFGFGIIEVVMIFGIFGIYAAPLIIMVKYLRGDKVKTAIISSAEPIAAADR